ncbi:MAG TPA: Rrf2 family transcriptional regulator [Rhabdaerophilum sp.]|nr:Rrf2 family transcriptional regulator [Rhabdaerophilum sp.]
MRAYILTMHLTAHTDYALRILMYAAARAADTQSDGRFSVEEVASAYNISRNHVMKIVQRLAASGYLKSYRGRNGGLALGKEPAEVRIGALVRFLEADCALVTCFSDASTCRICGQCVLQTALADALETFFAKLDALTLADLTLSDRAMRRLTRFSSPV